MNDTARKKRIAIVTTELGVGGAERCAVNLACHLNQHDYDVDVVSLASPPESPHDHLLQQLKEHSIDYTSLNVNSVWRYSRAVRDLTNLLRQRKPDLLQTFLFHANVVGARAAKRAGVENLVTGIRVTAASWPRRLIEKRITRAASRFICVSDDVRDYAVKEIGLDADRVVVIPNGVDVGRFQGMGVPSRAALDLPDDGKLIVSVGRMERQKGADVLIDAAPRILSDLPDHRLVLVGDGPLRAPLEEIADASEFGDRIHFVGWRPNSDEYIQACDLFVLPSRWEGMPNVLMEAMAARRPVVTSSTEGTRQLLGEAFDDCAVPVRAPVALATRVVEILKDQELRERLVNENFHRISEQFSLDQALGQYVKLYSDILGS